jgi:hypothetical protein
MTTFTSPELVTALMSERRREAAERTLESALRRALACCSTTGTGLRRLLPRRPATSR